MSVFVPWWMLIGTASVYCCPHFIDEKTKAPRDPITQRAFGWAQEGRTEEAATTAVWRARPSPQEGLVGAKEGVSVPPRGKT